LRVSAWSRGWRGIGRLADKGAALIWLNMRLSNDFRILEIYYIYKKRALRKIMPLEKMWVVVSLKSQEKE
jgi:hypothetical protein